MPPPTARPTGRPREFNEDDVLETAMRVFWCRGYEATSLDDLLEETGMARQSLYRVFGNKQELFVRALERYGASRRAFLEKMLLGAVSPLAGLHELLRLWERDACSSNSTGCFNLNTLAEFAGKEGDAVHRAVLDNLKFLERTLVTTLERAVAAGEIQLARAPREVAHSLIGVGQAVNHLGRSAVPRTMIRNIIGGARAELG